MPYGGEEFCLLLPDTPVVQANIKSPSACGVAIMGLRPSSTRVPQVETSHASFGLRRRRKRNSRRSGALDAADGALYRFQRRAGRTESRCGGRGNYARCGATDLQSI